MKNVLTIGGATQDIYLTYSGADYLTINKRGALSSYLLFESGEKVEIENIIYKTGGGATNSAATFSRLGFQTSCFCNIQDDNAGKAILQKLSTENIGVDFITVDKKNPTGMSFIINSSGGERTIFAYRGANSFLPEDKIPFDAIKECDQLYITSLSNQASHLLPKISAFAHQHNVSIAINPGVSQLAKGTEILKESLRYIDILIMNSYEAKNFMIALVESDAGYKKALESHPRSQGCKITQTEEKPYLIDTPVPYEDLYFSIAKFFKEIFKMGPTIVAITNGCNGVYVAQKDSIFFHPSMKIPVVDSVGAGDSFGSCFIASLQLGYSIQDSLRNGILNSASVLQHIGAKDGILNQEQLKKELIALDKNLLQKFNL
ncbi:MAG: carbohydrate kinase family protein [bacterium]